MNLPLWKREAEEMVNDCFQALSGFPTSRSIDYERVLHLADRQMQLIQWIEMTDQRVIEVIEKNKGKSKREV